MQAIRPLLELQSRWSRIPAPDELLIESISAAGIHAIFLYPFQGRLAHEGIGALLAYRLSRRSPLTVVSVCNDYGIGLRSEDPISISADDWSALLSPGNLLDDLGACLNTSNLARRQFRDIARIAGLIVPGFPGAQKPMRHVQASTQMFFDVFTEFDPGNLLLDQARREVLDNQFEVARLRAAMDNAASFRRTIIKPPHLTPLSFPIWAEQLRAVTLSTEKWADMVRKMMLRLEETASRPKRRTREDRRDPVPVGRRGLRGSR